MSDPLADMLTRIRNAGMVRYETVDVPMSNLKVGVAKVLREEGYINDYEIIEDNKQGTLRIMLKYGPNDERVISGIRRVSKPG
jgi:small subunit ribosomal protein S8